eukprot:CFRG1363T1
MVQFSEHSEDDGHCCTPACDDIDSEEEAEEIWWDSFHLYRSHYSYRLSHPTRWIEWMGDGSETLTVAGCGGSGSYELTESFDLEVGMDAELIEARFNRATDNEIHTYELPRKVFGADTLFDHRDLELTAGGIISTPVRSTRAIPVSSLIAVDVENSDIVQLWGPDAENPNVLRQVNASPRQDDNYFHEDHKELDHIHRSLGRPHIDVAWGKPRFTSTSDHGLSVHTLRADDGSVSSMHLGHFSVDDLRSSTNEFAGVFFKEDEEVVVVKQNGVVGMVDLRKSEPIGLSLQSMDSLSVGLELPDGNSGVRSVDYVRSNDTIASVVGDMIVGCDLRYVTQIRPLYMFRLPESLRRENSCSIKISPHYPNVISAGEGLYGFRPAVYSSYTP